MSEQPPPRRVIVCGGRDYDDQWAVQQAMETVLDLAGDHRPLIVHGGASGADALAAAWARHLDLPEAHFAALWGQYGRAAGPRRNAEMLAVVEPDLVVAFPGGAGTANMIRQAHAAGVRVWDLRIGLSE